ncbi:MAG: TetR/AcrR family transcriptional regulator C-terminal domain-containing protein [Chloroflexota bacterium]|nr:TetR/AcrR family transcriptional regulator C-terminal domain-containing protein [Chloroflexota bacterium]
MPQEREPDEGPQEQHFREHHRQLREQGRQRIHEHAAEMREHLHSGRRGKGRESRGRPPLSRDEVVRAALAIVDRDGLDAFSMRKLGAELGVDPMATYYYFPNKAAVLDGIVEAVYAEIAPPPDAGAPWDVRLRETFRGYRQALRAHPHALPVLSTHPSSTPLILEQEEAIIAILCTVGFSPVEAMWAISNLGGYVVGMALQEVGMQPGSVPDPTEEEIMAEVARLPPEKFPLLTAVFRSGFPFDADAEFEAGLDLFITGLKVRHSEIMRGAEGVLGRPTRARPRAPVTSHGRARRG